MKLRSLSILSVLCCAPLSCTSTPSNVISERPSYATTVAQASLAIADLTAPVDQQPMITNEMVDKICLKMPLAEVEAILGRAGRVVKDVESTTDPAQTYEWKNSDGSYAWATFAEGKLIGAGAVGLPGSKKAIDPFKSPIDELPSNNCLK